MSNPCLERKHHDFVPSPELNPLNQSDLDLMALPSTLTHGPNNHADDLYSLDVAQFQQSVDKHSLATYSSEDEPAAKKHEGDMVGSSSNISERKKPGRKPIVDEPTTKRKAQNRQAQRAFRERKEAHVKALETRIAELEQRSESQLTENELLKRKLSAMTQRMHAVQTAASGTSQDFAPPPIARDFTFELPSPSDSFPSSTSGSSPFGQQQSQRQGSRGSVHRNSDSGYSTATATLGGRRSDSTVSSHDRPNLAQQGSSNSSCPSLHSGSSTASPLSAYETDFNAASLPFFNTNTVSQAGLGKQQQQQHSESPEEIILRASAAFASGPPPAHSCKDFVGLKNAVDQFQPAADPLVFDDPFLQSTLPTTPGFLQYREPSNLDQSDMFAPLESVPEVAEYGLDAMSPTGFTQFQRAIERANDSSSSSAPPTLRKSSTDDSSPSHFSTAMDMLANMDNEPGKQAHVRHLMQNFDRWEEDAARLNFERRSKGLPELIEVYEDPEEKHSMCGHMMTKISSHPKFESFDLDDLCSDMQQRAACSEHRAQLKALSPQERLQQKSMWLDQLLQKHAERATEKLELEAQQQAFAMFCPK
ncbi:DNA-binding transcription factor yap1 [Savitreella phatthalungensis]